MKSSLVVVFLGISINLFLLICSTQISPYMDEIFHVPQAQKYCEYKFNEWDSMITTLPGLYLVSVGVLRPLSWLLRTDPRLICSVLWLRMINLLFSLGNVLLMYMILNKLDKRSKDASRILQQKSEKNENYEEELENKEGKCLYQMLTALSLGTFPVLYFFTFLYYTDTGSTFFVLFMYTASMYNHHFVAMVAGFWAIMFRQTNIIWVIFTAGITAANHLQPTISKQLHNKPGHLYEVVKLSVIEILKDFKRSLILLFPYVLLVIAFAGFVVVNGSIVVGDKSHHQACFHFPQIFYFSAFALFFFSPHILMPSYFTKLVQSIKSFRKPKQVLTFILIITLAIFFIHRFTYIHPYLLADNRHYPFYVWKNIFHKHWAMKYMLVPIYVIALWSMHFLLQNNSLLWQIIYFICVLLVLTPQLLLEFRYFIVPYLLARLHMQSTSYPKLFLEFCLYSVVNAFTLWMFVKKPFYWPDNNELQRFMW